MIQRKKKHKFSTGGHQIRDISEAFQQDLLRDMELKFPFREQHMTMDQLMDIYPLSRIDPEDPTRSLGLNDDEAEIRLKGTSERNIICPTTRSRSRWRLFLRQFKNTFRILLMVAAIACFFIFALDRTRSDELVMAIILVGVLIIMSIIHFVEEINTYNQISGFQAMIPMECTVVRGGRKISLAASDLIVGDLVWISTGDRVPADLRMLHSDELQIETSWLSGEVEPLSYTADAAPEGVGVFESQNIVFNGCSVTSGRGLGLIVRIGNHTVLGNLVELTSKEKVKKAPLDIEHRRCVILITSAAFIISFVTFVIGLALNGFSHITSTFVNGFLVSLVACVPQGLPVTLSSQLLIVARRLSKFGIYLKKLDIADSLGLTSILMVDKTGVLTENNLRVTDIWINGEGVKSSDLIASKKETTITPKSSGTRFEIEGSLIPGLHDHVAIMIIVMSVCDKAQIQSSIHEPQPRSERTPSFRRKNISLNPADLITPSKVAPADQYVLKHKDLKERAIIGKPIDVALIKFAEELTSVEQLRGDYEVVYEVPFSSNRRYHLVIVVEAGSRQAARSTASGEDARCKYIIMVKGAPEELILHCSTIVLDGEVDLDDEKMLEFEKTFLAYCNEGKSCLAFAMLEFEDFVDAQFTMDATNSNFPEEGWCFLGMAALYDPPLPKIRDAVKAADKAGIRLMMISGDHAVTAEAAARQMQFDFGDVGAAPHGSENSLFSDKPEDIEKSSPRSSSPSSFSTSSIRIDPIANLEVIRGDTVKELSKADWARLLTRKRVVFARTTPTQKMKIVRNCQLGESVVAATGDGVMDAPALKQADVGIALEAVGSVFAKEAADVVAKKPQLPNLVLAISHARLLFDNLKKTIAYSLSHLLPEMFPVWFTFIFGFPIGLNSLQILTIDLLSEIPPAIALVFEPAERDVMSRAPRRPNAHLATKALFAYAYIFAGGIISLGCILSYFTVYWSYGVSFGDLHNTAHTYWQKTSPTLTLHTGKILNAAEQYQIYSEASAAWHITLVVAQCFHLWMCTTRRISMFKHGLQNWTLVAACAFAFLTLFVTIYVPGINDILHVRGPAWYIWIFPIATGIVLLVFNETRKYFIRKTPKETWVRMLKW
uniref:Cation_ATPase_N domain-containing protein n=1 Tax=Panagrellus redivivus TaxID=6233 RepID=A0A7E4ZWL3_PANRE